MTITVKKQTSARYAILPLTLIAVCAVLLAFPLRSGMMLILNRFFELSEARNSYIYSRFDVSGDVSATGAAIALGIAATCCLALPLCIKSRALPIALMAVSAGFQAWSGLSLPTLANIGLFAYFALLLCTGGKRIATAVLIAVSVILSVILFPSVDPTTERLSEQARDIISGVFTGSDDSSDENGRFIPDARHENTRSLAYGENEAQAETAFRLVTVEKQEISLPHIIDYLRIAIMCLLVPILIAAPFLPFAWISLRRKKAIGKRNFYTEAAPREAVIAIMDGISSYLDFCDGETSNIPYSERRLPEAFNEEAYSKLYSQATRIFEEAKYSTHDISESQRGIMLDTFYETENAIAESADYKALFKLKYILCLYVEQYDK